MVQFMGAQKRKPFSSNKSAGSCKTSGRILKQNSLQENSKKLCSGPQVLEMSLRCYVYI